MLLLPIHELVILGVMDAGIANKERIVLRPTETVNMGMFTLFIGKTNPNNMITPYYDNALWFGDLVIQPPSWIFVYTGPGTFQQTTMPDTSDIAYIYHWGKATTVFNHTDIVPYILRHSGIAIGPFPPRDLFPQIKS